MMQMWRVDRWGELGTRGVEGGRAVFEEIYRTWAKECRVIYILPSPSFTATITVT
jgi:hypothetical protein